MCPLPVDLFAHTTSRSGRGIDDILRSPKAKRSSWRQDRRTTVANPWIMKMEQFTSFSDEDKQLLDELSSRGRRHYGAREDVLRESDPSPSCHLILSGLACRYKILEDGGRQIMAFLVPGDLCDPEVFTLKAMD